MLTLNRLFFNAGILLIFLEHVKKFGSVKFSVSNSLSPYLILMVGISSVLILEQSPRAYK
jgi:hypothetical protein